jgi:hypothetical protein
MTERREALEALLSSPGWQIVCEEAKKEWQSQLNDLQRKAVSDQDDMKALAKLRQVIAASDAVDWVLGLPDSLVKQLKQQEKVDRVAAPYRPALHPQLAQYKRGV